MSYDASDRWRNDVGDGFRPAFSDQDFDFPDVSLADPEPSPEDLAGQLTRSLRDNIRLTETVRRLRAQNAQLRARLVEQGARHDTCTVDDAVHATLADRFLDLVQQDMQHIVRTHLQSLGGRVTPEKIALEIRAICEELLVEAHDVPQACLRLGMDSAVLAAPLRNLIVKVKSLTDQVPPDVWDFRAASGDRIDPTSQRPWGQCELKDPVRFVVAPAYRTNGRTYALQLVFTAPKSRWPWS